MTEKMEQIEQKIRGTVQDTTESVKRNLDVKYHISERPWPALGIAVLAGYAIGSMGGDPSPARRPTSPDSMYRSSYSSGYSSPASAGYQSHSAPYSPQQPQQPQQGGILSGLTEQFGGEIEMVKAAAITSLVGLLRDTIRQNVPMLHQEMERMRQGGSGAPHGGSAGMSGAPSSYASQQSPRTSAAHSTSGTARGAGIPSVASPPAAGAHEREAGRGI